MTEDNPYKTPDVEENQPTRSVPRRVGLWLFSSPLGRLILLMMVYPVSYFAIPSYDSGSVATPRVYHWYDRTFPFDPGYYLPLAHLEWLARGKDTQICLQGPGARGGRPTYCIGPFRRKGFR